MYLNMMDKTCKSFVLWMNKKIYWFLNKIRFNK